MTNIYRTAHHANAALSIKPELYPRLGHIVPVDWQPGATDIGAAGDPNAFTGGKLSIGLIPTGKSILPIGAFDNLVNTSTQTHAADA